MARRCEGRTAARMEAQHRASCREDAVMKEQALLPGQLRDRLYHNFLCVSSASISVHSKCRSHD
eukprot:5811558-Pleurochrysis_carterae.AAC.1